MPLINFLALLVELTVKMSGWGGTAKYGVLAKEITGSTVSVEAELKSEVWC